MATQATIVGQLAPHEVCAPDRGWRTVVRDGSLVGSGTIAGQMLGVATSLLLRMLLSPAQMGLWQAFKLVLSYAGFVNLGVTKAATRELTIARGRGLPLEAQRSRNLAFTFSVATTTVYALALLGAAILIWSRSGPAANSMWVVGLGVIAAICVAQRFLTFHIAMLRAERCFAAAARLAILEAALTLCICGAGAWAFGLYGLLGGCLVVSIICGWVARNTSSVPPQWAWDLRATKTLIAVGLPIVLTGLVMTLFHSVDRIMLLAYLPDGAFQLGVYSTALLVTTQLSGVANILATTMAPRYGETFGRWRSERRVAQLAARATELHAAIAVLSAGLALVAGPPVLAWLLPDYAAGLPSLTWLIPGALSLAVAMPATQFLVTTKHQNRGLFVACVALAAAAAGNHIALSTGWGLLGVAAATCLAQMLFAVGIIAGSFWNLLSWQQRFRYVVAVAWTIGPTFAVAQLATRSSQYHAGDWSHVLVGVLMVVATWAVSCGIGWHAGRWGEMWRG